MFEVERDDPSIPKRVGKKDAIMSTYVTLMNWTNQGVKTATETVQRRYQADALAQKHGARIEQGYWTVGPYDIVAIIEARSTPRKLPGLQDARRAPSPSPSGKPPCAREPSPMRRDDISRGPPPHEGLMFSDDRIQHPLPGMHRASGGGIMQARRGRSPGRAEGGRGARVALRVRQPPGGGER